MNISEYNINQLSLITINHRKINIQNTEPEEEIESIFDIDIEIELITQTDSEDIGLIYKVKAFMGDETEATMVGDFEIEYVFRYAGLTKLMEDKENYEKLKGELNHTAYSTTRGIISVYGRGTSFESLVLPIMANDNKSE